MGDMFRRLPDDNQVATLTPMTEPPYDRHIPPLVSVTEAADILGMTRQGVLKAANNGQLRGRKAGATWVFRRVLVEREAARRIAAAEESDPGEQ